MSNQSGKLQGRRRILTGIGLAATATTLASSTQAASTDNAHRGFTPARHAEDAWLDANAASHRVFIDSSTTLGGTTALNYANNIFVGHAEGYDGAESDIAIIVCFRHGSTPLGYNDAMWGKYGEQFSQMMNLKDRSSDQAFRVNPMNLDRSDYANRGNTLDSLVARGVSYAICRKATRSFSGRLASVTGGDAGAIEADLLANNVANSRFVPAGVVAATRSQEYGYSLLYAG